MPPRPRMRALSIRQPYAELILRGIKKIECRSAATRTPDTLPAHSPSNRSSTFWPVMARDPQPRKVCAHAHRVELCAPASCRACSQVPILPHLLAGRARRRLMS